MTEIKKKIQIREKISDTEAEPIIPGPPAPEPAPEEPEPKKSKWKFILLGLLLLLVIGGVYYFMSSKKSTEAGDNLASTEQPAGTVSNTDAAADITGDNKTENTDNAATDDKSTEDKTTGDEGTPANAADIKADSKESDTPAADKPGSTATSSTVSTTDNGQVPYKKGEFYKVYEFPFGDAAYTRANPELDKLVKVMNDNPSVSIIINAYTDKVGTAEYNLALSENRARAIYDYMVRKGIDKSRLSYSGKGISTKYKTNSENRRAEFILK